MFWEAKNSTVVSKFASLPRPVRKKACPMVMRVSRGARKARAAAALSPNRAARVKDAGAGITNLHRGRGRGRGASYLPARKTTESIGGR